VRLADNILELQKPDGSWAFKLYKPEDEAGISDKGTPLWSMLLYQLYQETGDPRHLMGAQKALLWCMNNQYHGKDSLGLNGIVGQSWAAGIVYRNYFPLICTYTMEWFGLALLEQVNLGN